MSDARGIGKAAVGAAVLAVLVVAAGPRWFAPPPGPAPRDLLEESRDLVRAGRLREAGRTLDAILARDPGAREAWVLAMDAAAELGDAPRRVALARRVLAARPGDAELAARAARVLEEAGDTAGAAAALAAAGPGPDPVARARERVRLLLAAREVGAAVEVLDGLLLDHPEDAALLVLRGRAARLAGDPASATRFLTEAQRRDQGTPGLFREFGHLRRDAGKRKEARTFYTHALRADPGDREARAALDGLYEAAGYRSW